MMPVTTPVFTLQEIMNATGGRLLAGRTDLTVRGVSTDSRQLVGENLFVALKGENFNGHDFLDRAAKIGAFALLVQAGENIELKKVPSSIGVVEVTDTLAALGDLAHAHRMRFSVPVIGLTGSSGKTTTREMLAAILGMEKQVLTTQGNYNNLIGLPQTIFQLTARHDAAVLEMGTNTRGEIKRLTEIAAPDIGLITNIGPAHLAGFGSVEAVREEKGALWTTMKPTGCAVVNLDDESVGQLAQRWTGSRVTYSMSADADVTVKDIKKRGAKGVRFQLVCGGRSCRIDMNIAGIHHIYNAMAAAAAARAFGAGHTAICEGLASFLPVRGRMEIVALQNGAYLVDDSYNANPASVREALLTLRDLKSTHRAFVFLGDMLELGEAAPEMHRKIGTLLGTTGVTAVFLQGDYAGNTASGALDGGLTEDQIIDIESVDASLDSLKKKLRKGDWVLVKGSRGMKMDRIAAGIRAAFGVDSVHTDEATH
ncbi:MAG: UDP-N-acetylmuramoyl-tripeptide--D-alanyl-D-alanine ligase [Smithellaceae bacterium]